MVSALCWLSWGCGDDPQPTPSPDVVESPDGDQDDDVDVVDVPPPTPDVALDTPPPEEISPSDVDDTTPEEVDAAPEAEVAPAAPADLIDNANWELALPAADPWYGDGSKADDELCEPESYQLENTPDGEFFEVDTSFCGYVTFQQDLLADIPEGGLVEVKIGHYPIEDGTGPYLIAVGLGDPGEEVWSTEVVPPADPGVLDGTFTADKAHSAGDPVFWHVSNHGENHWFFVHLKTVPGS